MAVDFEIPAEAQEIRETVRKFVHEHCIPAEQELIAGRPYREVLDGLRSKARAQELSGRSSRRSAASACTSAVRPARTAASPSV